MRNWVCSEQSGNFSFAMAHGKVEHANGKSLIVDMTVNDLPLNEKIGGRLLNLKIGGRLLNKKTGGRLLTDL